MAEREQIILLYGDSDYQVFETLIHDIAQAFEALGYAAPIFRMVDDSWSGPLLQTVKQHPVKCFLALNSLGFKLVAQGRPLYDVVKIPLVAYFLDHPMYHVFSFPKGLERVLMTFCDAFHPDYLKFLRLEKYPTAFIPHGSMQYTFPLKPFQSRQYDVVFSGPIPRRKWSLKKSGRRLARSAA